MSELYFQTLIRTRDMLCAGEISAREVTAACLDRIERTEPALHALLHVNAEVALSQAEALDAQGPDPARPLWGVPITLKDGLATRDMPTTCASEMLEDFRPAYDAHCVTRLRESGAIILGKNNMDEFAMGSSTENSAWGPTKIRGTLTGCPADPRRLGGRRGLGTMFCRRGHGHGRSIRQPPLSAASWV